MKFHIHDWGKYGAPFDSAHDEKKLQAKQCKTCEKIKIEKVSAPWNVWFTARTVLESLKGTKE